jgi:hypothetical protein
MYDDLDICPASLSRPGHHPDQESPGAGKAPLVILVLKPSLLVSLFIERKNFADYIVIPFHLSR